MAAKFLLYTFFCSWATASLKKTPNLDELNYPFVLNRAVRMHAYYVHRTVEGKGWVGQGVVLEVIPDNGDPQSIQEKLKTIERDHPTLELGEEFLRRAPTYFSLYYITQGIFIQWTDSDGNILRRAWEEPEMLLAKFTDYKEHPVGVCYEAHAYRTDSLISFTFSLALGKPVDLDPKWLEEFLIFASGREIPRRWSVPIIRKLGRPNSNLYFRVWIPKGDTPLPDFYDVFEFEDQYNVLVRERWNPITKNLLQYQLGENSEKQVTLIDPNQSAMSVKYLASPKPDDPITIRFAKEKGKPIVFSPNLLWEILLEMTGLWIPMPRVNQVTKKLTEQSNLHGLTLKIPLDADLRIWQLSNFGKVYQRRN